MGSPSGATFATVTSAPTRTPMSISLRFTGPIARMEVMRPDSPGLSFASSMSSPHDDPHGHAPTDRDPGLVHLHEDRAARLREHLHPLAEPEPHLLDACIAGRAPSGHRAAERDDLAHLSLVQEAKRQHRQVSWPAWMSRERDIWTSGWVGAAVYQSCVALSLS